MTIHNDNQDSNPALSTSYFSGSSGGGISVLKMGIIKKIEILCSLSDKYAFAHIYSGNDKEIEMCGQMLKQINKKIVMYGKQLEDLP